MNVDFRKKVQWTTPDVTQCITSFNTVDEYAMSRMMQVSESQYVCCGV